MQNLLRAPVLKALLPPAHGDGAGACGLRLAVRLATRAIADPTPRLRALARSGSIGERIQTFASTSGAGCAERMRTRRDQFLSPPPPLSAASVPNPVVTNPWVVVSFCHPPPSHPPQSPQHRAVPARPKSDSARVAVLDPPKSRFRLRQRLGLRFSSGP